jgi:predicted glutamine amidotransferase
MCRLLAWVTTSPRSVAEVLGDRGASEFAALGEAHPDGWGIAWSGQGTTDLVREVSCAAGDGRFAQLCRQVRSTAGVTHLRRATPGMAVSPENSHPFAIHDLVMAHNGGIYPLNLVDKILPPAWEAVTVGTTDSERYAMAVVAAQQTTGTTITDALIDVIARLFQERFPSSLNAICLSPDSVLVASAHNPYVPEEAIGEPADSYYALRYRRFSEGIVVASSGIDQPVSDGWRTLENMTLMVINRRSAEFSIQKLPIGLPTEFRGVPPGSASHVR